MKFVNLRLNSIHTFILTTVFTLITCSSACKPKTLSQGEIKIVNGEQSLDNPTIFTFHNGITAKGGRCSAIKIAPKTFLTAGHCILPHHIKGYKTVFTNSQTVKGFSVVFAGTPEIHPDYKGSAANNDLALIKLVNDIPGPQALITSTTPKADVNMPAYVFGGGCTELGKLSDGKMRFAASVIIGVNRTHFVVRNTLGSGQVACPGDSGGGAFRSYGAPWEVIGISSYVNKKMRTLLARVDTPAIHEWIKGIGGNSVKFAPANKTESDIVATSPSGEGELFTYAEGQTNHQLISAGGWVTVAGFKTEFQALACLIDYGLDKVILAACSKNAVEAVPLEGGAITVNPANSTILNVDRDVGAQDEYEAKLTFLNHVIGYIYPSPAEIKGARSFKICYAAGLSHICKTGVNSYDSNNSQKWQARVLIDPSLKDR